MEESDKQDLVDWFLTQQPRSELIRLAALFRCRALPLFEPHRLPVSVNESGGLDPPEESVNLVLAARA